MRGPGTTDDAPQRQVVDLQTVDLTVALPTTRYTTPEQITIELGFVETATPDHPASVRAAVTNDDEYENVIHCRRHPPFAPMTAFTISHEASGPTLYLVPTDEYGLVDETPAHQPAPDGIWRLVEEPREWLSERRRMVPGETITGEFLLLGDPERADYPPGIYRHEDSREGLALATWQTTRPGPDGKSVYDDTWYPPRLPRADGTRWFHKTTPDSTVYVEPSDERVELPARVDFTLVNHSQSAVEAGDSTLYKLENGTWHSLDPTGGLSRSSLAPGAERSFTIRKFPDEVVPCTRATDYGFLGGGTYAFDTGYRTEVRYGSTGLNVAAIVTLDGPPVDLAPEDALDIERSGTTVTVTDERHGEADDLHEATIALERTDEAEETFIAEQLMQPSRHGLRNCLPFFEDGVDRVVLHSDVSATSTVLSAGADAGQFVVDGQAYTARLIDP